MRFAAIRPDPTLPSRITPNRRGRRSTLYVCEFEETMALNMAADLSVLFPAEAYRIEPKVVHRATDIVASTRGRIPLLFPPRVWDTLSSREREKPHVHALRYVFSEGELESLAREFDWQPTRSSTRLRAI